MNYLIGVLLMLGVIAGCWFLDQAWTPFPAIGVAASASFLIGTSVRRRADM